MFGIAFGKLRQMRVRVIPIPRVAAAAATAAAAAAAAAGGGQLIGLRLRGIGEELRARRNCLGEAQELVFRFRAFGPATLALDGLFFWWRLIFEWLCGLLLG